MSFSSTVAQNDRKALTPILSSKSPQKRHKSPNVRPKKVVFILAQPKAGENFSAASKRKAEPATSPKQEKKDRKEPAQRQSTPLKSGDSTAATALNSEQSVGASPAQLRFIAQQRHRQEQQLLQEAQERIVRITNLTESRLIGAGGFGKAYLNKAGTIVTKTMAVGRSARFELEAFTKYNLQHPNIIKYLDHLTQADTFYLQIEYGGESVTRILRTQPSLADRQTLFTATTKAIAYIHSKKLMHRDLKPDNVVALYLKARAENHPLQEREVKLIDLGSMSKEGERDMGAYGTPLYFAPGTTAIDVPQKVIKYTRLLDEARAELAKLDQSKATEGSEAAKLAINRKIQAYNYYKLKFEAAMPRVEAFTGDKRYTQKSEVFQLGLLGVEIYTGIIPNTTHQPRIRLNLESRLLANFDNFDRIFTTIFEQKVQAKTLNTEELGRINYFVDFAKRHLLNLRKDDRMAASDILDTMLTIEEQEAIDAPFKDSPPLKDYDPKLAALLGQ